MNIALLIDCENAKPDSIDGILGELAEKGTISIRRAEPAVLKGMDLLYTEQLPLLRSWSYLATSASWRETISGFLARRRRVFQRTELKKLSRKDAKRAKVG